MPIGPRWRGARTEADDMEESLLRAMDEDPRLASGVEVPRADNVLDFIQMTGLTTGRVPAASELSEHPDDPISFFEYGVRDVDGSGDPEEMAYPELDAAAFHIDTTETITQESKSIAELRQIIADLAAMESDIEESASVAAPPAPMAAAPAPAEARATRAEPSPPTAPRIVAEIDRPAPVPRLAPKPTAHHDPDPTPRAEIDFAADSEPTIELDVEQNTDELPEVALDTDDGNLDGDAEPYASPMRSPEGLAAARDLLRELAKANDAAERAEKAFAREAAPAPESFAPPPSLAGMPPHPALRAADDVDEQTTHQGLLRRRREPMLGRWAMRALAVALAIGAGVGGFLMYERAVQPPRAAYDAAQSLIDKGRFEDASNAFLDFTKRFPGSPRRAEAMYMAGYALQLVPEDPVPRAKEAYTESIALLGGFIEEYPAHEKTPRAETLLGVLYFKTGRHLEAINLLGDPNRRLRDPGAYLIALRTLGRSYAAVNQMDNARNAFMRAGALESNMAPDEDYAELAGLYTQLAERSGDPAQRRRLFQQAVEQWDFALQVPGLIKARKDDMKLLRDVAASKVDNEFGTAARAPGEAAGSRVRALTRGTPQAGPASPVL